MIQAGRPMAAANNNDLSASLEDYLEAIFNIASQSKIARSKDIAKMLGVSKSSVTGALRALKEKGLANYEPSRGLAKPPPPKSPENTVFLSLSLSTS